MATITDAVYQYLIAQGIVRDARVAGPLPPAFRQPRDGVPAPGEGSGTVVGPTAVVGLIHGGGIPAPLVEIEWRRDTVDVLLRTATWPVAETLYAQIRAALCGTSALLKQNWVMGGMRVISSQESRALGLVDSGPQGFTSLHQVLFETYAADHF